MKEHEIKIAEFEKKFTATRNLSKKFKFYWENKVFVETHDPIKNLEYIQKMLQAAIKKDDKYIEHLLYIFQGYLYRRDGFYDKALNLYNKSKNYFKATDDQKNYAKIISDISVIFATLGLQNQACFLWKDLLRNYIDKKDLYQRGIIINNLITTSITSYQNYDQVEIVLNELLDEMKESINNTYHYNFIYCKSMINMGFYHYTKYNDFKKSLAFYEKALSIVDEIHDLGAKYEIYVKIADCYKGLKDEVNRISFLIKARKTIANSENNLNCLYLFKELYHYYKTKEDMKKALMYFEIVHALELQKKDQENKVNSILENMGINSNEKINIDFLKEYSKKHIFDFNREVFLENIKGVMVKISLDAIISVTSYSKMIKIHFVDNTHLIYKISMKEFSDLLLEKFGEDHLFFSTNLRSEMVNLFWMSHYDKLNKKLYFNVLGEEIVFELTRIQSVLLRDYLKIN